MPGTDVITLAVSTSWIEIALVIFLVVFLAILGWVLFARPGAFDEAARIPLNDDVVTERKATERGSDEATKGLKTEP